MWNDRRGMTAKRKSIKKEQTNFEIDNIEIVDADDELAITYDDSPIVVMNDDTTTIGIWGDDEDDE